MGITTMVSTMTNINANIFSGSNTIGYMADQKRVSPILARPLFLRQGNLAMVATVGIVILMILSLDISQIGDVASAVFLLVHTFIPLGVVLHRLEKTGGSAVLLWLGALANGGLLLFFLWHLAGKHDTEIIVLVGTVLFAAAFIAASRSFLGPANRLDDDEPGNRAEIA
ncbi:MAG: hypothetical protein CMN74_03120 [Sphingorhabdus sp.]|nr:hypothetical protein [Sphingorhabdus sp.]